MDGKLRVGIMGMGNISPAYVDGVRAFDILELAACADIDAARAQAAAERHNIPRALLPDDLLADPNIDLVVNLTVPAVHAEVSRKILAAGKHVYSEKPLATTLEDGRSILDLAEKKGLRVGCAPDTFLFAPHQTARRLVDDGVIGRPVAAVGFMMGHGPEGWHPNPDFFYAPGGGPMFDMGPYYITCLVNLLGAVTSVSAVARPSFPERTAGDGHKIPVSVPTHYAGTLDFASGAIGTLITSFDIWGHHLPQMEIYGETGSLTIPDPNGHDPRHVNLFDTKTREWVPQPLTYEDNWKRGIGIADMAYAIHSGRPHRASGALAYHVLEVMRAYEISTETGTAVKIASRPEQPKTLPLDLAPRTLDA